MSLATAYALKRRGQKMAAGGFVGKEEAEYDPTEEPMPKGNEMATMEDDRDLNQHGAEEQGPDSVDMAEGGCVSCEMGTCQEHGAQGPEHMLDMVGRIMAARQHHYSKGGMVANDTPIKAGFMPNDFDDLALRADDMEDADYTGPNSGDEVGDEGEDERRKDIVSRIMKSRGKRDRMPSPA